MSSDEGPEPPPLPALFKRPTTSSQCQNRTGQDRTEQDGQGVRIFEKISKKSQARREAERELVHAANETPICLQTDAREYPEIRRRPNPTQTETGGPEIESITVPTGGLAPTSPSAAAGDGETMRRSGDGLSPARLDSNRTASWQGSRSFFVPVKQRGRQIQAQWRRA